MEGDGGAGDWDQRARMQHLGAVVRHLGGFAVVQLRNEAGVRDDPRVGGQNAGHVLPQHHRPCAE